MSSLIQWPFKRKTYSGVNNPRFVSDIQAANEAVYDAITAITGLNNTDFAIISGLDFVAGSPNNTFTSGIFYLNGVIYVMAAAFNENFYLAPNVTDIMNTPFEAGIGSRFIYTVNYAQTSSTASGNTPRFTGNMNQYRIGLKYFRASIISLLATQTALKSAAFAALGTGTGQILTANQTYTQAQVNALILTRAPSIIGSMVEVYDFAGTFATSFDGNGLGTVFPWYNATTGERWGIMNGVATTGGNTAPNLAGKVTIGSGVDSGSNTFIQGNTYGSNKYKLLTTDIPPLPITIPLHENGTANSSNFPAVTDNNAIFENDYTGTVNTASPTNDISLMQSSFAVYKVIRLA